MQTVELFSNPRRRRRRRTGSRARHTRRRRVSVFVNPRRRRRRRNPLSMVPFGNPHHRRRRHRGGRIRHHRRRRHNPGLKALLSPKGMMRGAAGALPDAAIYTGLILGSWVATKTVLDGLMGPPASGGSRDVGVVGWGTNVATGAALGAVAGMVLRKPGMLKVGIAAGITAALLRIGTDFLRGKTFPAPIKTGFEGLGQHYQDYLVRTPPHGDYLIGRSYRRSHTGPGQLGQLYHDHREGLSDMADMADYVAMG